MKSKWVVFSLLIVVVFLSGCVGPLQEWWDSLRRPKPLEYNDNALDLWEYKAQTRIFPGQKTWIEFWLTNQAEYDVENVDVKMFNPNVFDITEITCSGGEKTDDGCHYDKIQSLDSKRVHLVLKAPSKEEIGILEEDYKVEFSVKYDYNGETVFYFRILDEEEESTESKSQLTQTVGPIHVNIEPGFLIEEKRDFGIEKITDWAIEGMPFSVKVSLENVGDLKEGYEYPEIKMKSFELTLKNVYVKEDDKEYCDFKGDDVLTIEDITVPMKKKGVTVPEKPPFVCVLTPIKDFAEPEIPGWIRTQYSYRYGLIKEETITVGTT